MPTASQDFVHLHLHTDYSLLDGCSKTSRLFSRASELGMSAVAMTDHGNLFGAIDFYKSARKAGIKPLIGCEIYLVHDHKMEERPKRERKRNDDIDDVPEDYVPQPEDYPHYQIHHKGLIARNFEGYQNLSKLVSTAHTQGMYYRPRVGMEELARYSEGLIGLSGCMNGVASQHLIYNNYEKAREVTGQFIDIFGKENYFIELQDHGMPFQQRIIPDLLKLAREFDLKIICTNDVHYVYRDDAQPHDALLCIQTGKLLSDENRMKYPSQEFYLKSREEMAQVFKEVPESLDNTLAVAEMVDLEIPFSENHYPVFRKPSVDIGRGESDFDRILDVYVLEKNKVNRQNQEPEIPDLTREDREQFKENGLFLFDLCKKGLKERYGIDYAAIRAEQAVAAESIKEQAEPGKSPEEDPDFQIHVCNKLDYELAIITGTGFVDYFLITWDFIDWARRQDIPVGPGRGSGAGCLVAYLLKITDIDPLRFGLLFERMLSLERVSPPDFDVDFCMRRRDAVVEYVREKYGADRVANIITFGTFGAKMIVRDLARVNEVPYAEADRLAKMVPDELNISLSDAVAKSGELQQEIKSNPIARQIIDQGKVIEGMVRNTGKHACGIIIGDQPLTNLVPVTLQEGDLTTQYPKGPVEDLGMLKADFLGLKTLTVIADAQDNVRRTRDLPDFNIEKVTLEDGRTYQLLNTGKTTGVFQLESGGMQALCRQIGLSSFEEIIALIALYRPGPMQFIPNFIAGKKDPSSIDIPHPLLEDLVSETYGVLVYQEQVMEVARIIAGYTLGDADLLRRAMGKKIRQIMEQQKEVFVEGAKKHRNIDRSTAVRIFDILGKFAEYGFNKSHSAAYAMLSYRTAYLKANFPVEFMAAVLSSELGNADKVSHFVDECGAMGIPVLGPDINESRESFTPVLNGADTFSPTSSAIDGEIRFGLAAIKGVGDGAARSILEERDAQGNFTDFEEFLKRIDMKSVNKRTIEHLVKSGAFDGLDEDRGILLEDMEAAIGRAQQAQKDKEIGQEGFFHMLDPEPEQSNGSHGHAQQARNGRRSSVTQAEILQMEKDLLGFYVSGHPLDPYGLLAEKLNSFEGDSFTELPDRAPFRLCGVVSNIQKRLTRRDNKPWAQFSLATKRSSYQLTAFNEAYENFGNLLNDNALLVAHGSTAIRDGDVTLRVNQLLPLDSALATLIKKITWVLDSNSSHQVEEFLSSLRQSLDDDRGNTALEFGFVLDSAEVALTSIAGSLTWNPKPGLFKSFRAHPAVVETWIEPEEVPNLDTRPSWMKRKRN